MMAWDSDSYNDVPARILEFRKRHPDGTLQSEVIRWPEPDFPFLAVEARAYRTPSDERPGVGLAYEPWPGKTNFTRDSELQNAETSAWGRAIIAVGAADAKKGIASAEEVRNRTSPARASKARGGATPAPAGDTPLGGGEALGEGATPPSDDIRAAMSNYLSLCDEASLKPLQTLGKALGRTVKTDDLLHASLADTETAIAYVASQLLAADA